jgi:tripartite-type tricarboxylate transporter receptor subunit TctC
MIRRKFMLNALATTLAAASFPAATAADYPAKTIKIVVPFTAGSATDLSARIFARRLQDRLKQPVIIENKPGAGGIIGLDFAAKAPPDGHTLVLSGPGLSTLKVLNKTLPFDPVKDLVPVSLAYESMGAVAINAAVPANTMAEFVAYAKANRGKVNYASLGRNTVMLGFEAFKSATGIEMTEIPFTGSPAALQAVLRNDAQIFNGAATQIAPYVESGKLRVVAVTSQQRLAILPDAPTLAEAGFANLRFPTWGGFLAPAGTPQEIVARLSSEIAAIAAEPEARQALLATSQLPIGSTSEAFRQVIDTDRKLWADVARSANIQPD